jgi:uncharacterized iron-regulated membrane protein
LTSTLQSMTMSKNNKRQKQVRLLQFARKTHRKTGAFLFVFFLLIAVTGFLLGWKKDSRGLIQPKAYAGISTDLKKWLPIDSLHTIACNILHDSVSAELSLDLEKIDIKKDKGMVKFGFIDQYWGIQLDGTTGQLLNIQKRRSDLIENLHDGSILDLYFRTKGEPIKLFYTSTAGLALFIFLITGFWLWYGPKRMKK